MGWSRSSGGRGKGAVSEIAKSLLETEAQTLQDRYGFEGLPEEKVLFHNVEEKSLLKRETPFGPSVESLDWHHSVTQRFKRNRSVSYHRKTSKSDKSSPRPHLHHTFTTFIEMWSVLYTREFLTVIRMPFSLPSSFSTTQAPMNVLKWGRGRHICWLRPTLPKRYMPPETSIWTLFLGLSTGSRSERAIMLSTVWY